MRRWRAVAFALVAALMAWAGVSVARDSAPSHAAKAQASLQLGVAHPAEHYPPIGTKPITFLVLGDSTGRTVEESRISDSIHLVGYNPQLDRATILGFPRDLWIPIPGHGTTKINAATQYGGPQLMIQTIEDLTGIRRGLSQVRHFLKSIGLRRLKVGFVPAKADVEEQERFKKRRTGTALGGGPGRAPRAVLRGRRAFRAGAVSGIPVVFRAAVGPRAGGPSAIQRAGRLERHHT